jgi:predicted O-linked N-acetylglucosamine transferase (SPINDLY family)
MELDSGQLFDALGRYEAVTLPYHGFVDRDLNAKFGEFVTRHSHRAIPDLGEPVPRRKPDGKLRVGFISGTMRSHQASRWAIGFLNNPPEDIETYAFQLGPHFDAMTALWKQRANHFFMPQGSAPEIGRFIKSLELDVLVHLDPQEVARAKLFATFKLAPLQVTMWGTPFTCGFPELTHYFSSDAMEPPDADCHYSETLIRLSGFGLCYERILIGNPTPFDKSLLGPGPHFLVAQNSLKLLPRRDALFKRVTEATNRPLLLIDNGDYSTDRLKLRLARAGVATHWLPKMGAEEFLGLLAAVDASLDTPDWNGSNTTIEAFLVGTPVISTPGIHLRGRHSLGFYKVLGGEDMVAKDENEYLSHVLNPGELKERVRKLPVGDLFDRREATETFYEKLRVLYQSISFGIGHIA